MKKAVLITIFRVPNYGSVLQAFATMRILKTMGYDCHVIDYLYPNEWHYSHGTKRYKKTFLKKLLINLLWLFGLKKGMSQARNLNRFIESEFNLTVQFSNLDELNSIDWKDYDLAVVGSDQVWNPNYLHGDSAFMLSFISDNIKKTSIASSFATSYIHDELVKKYIKYLNRFSSITVREDNGKSLISNIISQDIPVDVVLDPTLLIDSQTWQSILNCKCINAKKKYLLFYYLGYSFKSAPYIFQVVEYFSTKLGLEIRAICGEQSNVLKNYIDKYIDETGCGVERFVSLFADASMVVTSSFHGTAFAVNFQKPLIAVVPNNGDDRQTTLLRNLGMDYCAIQVGTPLDTITPAHYNNTSIEKLSSLREKSLSIIKRNING